MRDCDEVSLEFAKFSWGSHRKSWKQNRYYSLFSSEIIDQLFIEFNPLLMMDHSQAISNLPTGQTNFSFLGSSFSCIHLRQKFSGEKFQTSSSSRRVKMLRGIMFRVDDAPSSSTKFVNSNFPCLKNFVLSHSRRHKQISKFSQR